MSDENNKWDIQEYQVIKVDYRRFDVNTIMGGELSDGVGKLLEEGKKNIILDFSKVAQISSVGLGAVASAYREISEQSGTLKIIGVQESVLEVIQSTRFDQFVELHMLVEK